MRPRNSDPLVAIIEVVSFLSRPSASPCVCSPTLAGHITLKVFTGLYRIMSALGSVSVAASAVLPLIMTVTITGLEVLVAASAGYVFAILTCMYLNDTIRGIDRKSLADGLRRRNLKSHSTRS